MSNSGNNGPASHYDSTADTVAHIDRVGELMLEIEFELGQRRHAHDRSKLEPPEKEYFDSVSARLSGMRYGSREYRDTLTELGPALEHHYANNDHHPESHQNGIRDMDLIQLLEMLADWKAAGERHANGGMGLAESIRKNALRFRYDERMVMLLMRTAENLGWLAPSPAHHQESGA